MNERQSAGVLRLLFVVVVWGLAFRLLSEFGVRLLPIALARQLTLQSYLALVALLTSVFGLGIAWLLLEEPRDVLALRPPRALELISSLLLAPAVFVITVYFATAIARPTLLEELRHGGRELAQRSTGEFGQQLTRAPALLTLFWGALVTPVAEELFFRGALWSFLQQLVGRVKRRSDGLRSGGIATLASAGLFAALHADMPGGLGIVRFVSALGLGLACGIARQHSSSLIPPILLHVLYNVLSIASARRWVVTSAWPIHRGVPMILSLVAAASIAMLLLLLIGKRRLRV